MSRKMKENIPTKVKLISEYFVKPKYEVDASKQPHYLNPMDIIFLSLEPMQKGLLFATKPINIQSDLLDKLKDSISHSLVHYYPLAGRLDTMKFPDEHAIWVHVDNNKGPGAQLMHATVNLRVADILNSVDVHPIVPSFFDLGEKTVNYDGHCRSLLSIQVTELADGVFIGFTINHCLADGVGLWNYISTLSEIFVQLASNPGHVSQNNNRVISISRKPIFEPHILGGYGPILKLPFLEPNEFVVHYDPGQLRERIFHFSLDSIRLLKTMANEQCGVNNISSFQALSGLLWRSITHARNLQPDQDTSCGFSVSYRDRLNPSFSIDYFGNYIFPTHGSCKVNELLGSDFGWAALLIHKTLAAQDEKSIRKYLKKYAKTPIVASKGSEEANYLPNSVLIAGSARFDMYGPEFGLGKAVSVLAGYANKDDGKVTANPGRKGGGSVDLEVCLKPEIMDALELDEEFMSFVSH